MLAAADQPEQDHGTRNEQAPATWPVRLLVPTQRLSDYWLSLPDTLRASDLGITRHTTDQQLDAIVADVGQTSFAAYRDDLLRLRDALRHPRDIAEAREWGFDIPRKENAEEFAPNPRKRLGWWWVYDPNRTETLEQRGARYLSDERVIDMRGFARVVGRAYITIKDLKFEGDNVRVLLENPAHLDEMARAAAGDETVITVDDAKATMTLKAREDVLKALPPRRGRAGQSDLWWVCDAIKFGRLTGRLGESYARNNIKQTGRPRGARTRNRRTDAQ